MSLRVELVFNDSDYSGYGDVNVTQVGLTSKQAAIIASVAVLLTYRDAWEPISDVDFDSIQELVASAIDSLEGAI